MVSPGLLNKVEMAFRCYDPCNSCGTHSLDGGPALEVTVRRADGSVVTKQRNF
jgi:F420-non-reducing hydrogenase large subunit